VPEISLFYGIKITMNRDEHNPLAWCEIHKEELMQNWELAKDGKSLNEIQPLVQELIMTTKYFWPKVVQAILFLHHL
jgi:hypothetical protein